MKLSKTVYPSKIIEAVKQSTPIYYMFEGYYTKPLWGGKGVWGSLRGFRADPPKWPFLAKGRDLRGLPWTPLRTLKPPNPLKGVWYSTPQTYNRLELIALQLLWFLRDIPFWSVSPSILYTVKFEVLGGTLNMQKVELFFTWWSPWVQMNGKIHINHVI